MIKASEHEWLMGRNLPEADIANDTLGPDIVQLGLQGIFQGVYQAFDRMVARNPSEVTTEAASITDGSNTLSTSLRQEPKTLDLEAERGDATGLTIVKHTLQYFGTPTGLEVDYTEPEADQPPTPTRTQLQFNLLAHIDGKRRSVSMLAKSTFHESGVSVVQASTNMPIWKDALSQPGPDRQPQTALNAERFVGAGFRHLKLLRAINKELSLTR